MSILLLLEWQRNVNWWIVFFWALLRIFIEFLKIENWTIWEIYTVNFTASNKSTSMQFPTRKNDKICCLSPKIYSSSIHIERFTLIYLYFLSLCILLISSFTTVYTNSGSSNGSSSNNTTKVENYNNNNWEWSKPSAQPIKWWLHVCLCNVQTTIITATFAFCVW